MRWRTSAPIALLAAASAVALAQRGPESILPPGFGQPEPPAAGTAPPRADPSNGPRGDQRGDPRADTQPDTPARNDAADVTDATPAPPIAGDEVGEVVETLGTENVTDPGAEVLPVAARRSLDRIGLIDEADGGFGPAGFGTASGPYLTTLMQRMRAPLASRWASIALRRALLSTSAIPAGTNGADWVAERAWLLVRMGEADMARALVQRVDAENYTPRLAEVAMQAALATGDPAVVCAVAESAAQISRLPSWPLAQAMCAGLSGEPGTASALVDRVRDKRLAGGIDILLAEKVIGAGSNTRRAVNIQWDGVDRLTAWRFGLATATGLAIPIELYATAGPQVQGWLARAPLIPPAARMQATERAAELGVVSSAALVDFYAALWDATDPADRGDQLGSTLRTAFAGDDAAGRLAAIRTLWGADRPPYARQLMTARAAARIAPSTSIAAADVDRLLAAMLSAGLDLQAERFGSRTTPGPLGAALLAVGSARPLAQYGIAEVRANEDSGDNRRAKLVLAGLAGLQRLDVANANSLAERYQVPLERSSSWTRALDRAVGERAPAQVVLLAATGLQTYAWQHVPPEHLYRIVSALRRVGLEPEARMIAAEALARS